MTSSEDIRTSQQLANAAEAFVEAVASLFPDDSFDQFFHGSTLRRAYWAALQVTLDCYTTPETAPLSQGLMRGQVLAEPAVVEELLKLFLPGQRPNYAAVASHWARALGIAPGERTTLEREAVALFDCLEDELRSAPDLRVALQQIAEARHELIAAPREEDLGRLLDVALLNGPGTLGRQVRHLLALAETRDPAPPAETTGLLAALSHLAEHLPADALLDLWEAVDALADTPLRLRLTARLAPQLARLAIAPDPLALLQNVLARCDPPADPALCVDVLLALAPHISAPLRDELLPSLQQRVLDAVQAIEDPASRVRALGVLIEKLPPDLQAEAAAQAFDIAACCIPSDLARATALAELPPHLPPSFLGPLHRMAHDMKNPEARTLLLSRMVAFLPPGQQYQALDDALDAIEQITGDEARAQAIIRLAPHIDAMGLLLDFPEGLQQAIMVIFSIESEDERARAFSALAPYLSPELLGEALQAIKGIANETDRAITLADLAPSLPDDLAVAAFGIAQEMLTPGARSAALCAIAPFLSATARSRALTDALAASLAIGDRYDRVVALVDLAPHLPDRLQARALQEALTASRSIPDEDERARALVFLAPHLPEDALADALADTYTIADPLTRVTALSALLPWLPDEPRARVAQDEIERLRHLTNGSDRASILASMAPSVPAALLDTAIQAALAIESPYDRIHVLAALLPRAPERLHAAALEAAAAVPDRYQRVTALLELVPHMTAEQQVGLLDEALATALSIEDDYDRASMLAQLAHYLGGHQQAQSRQQDALGLALDSCWEVPNPAARGELLARLARIATDVLSPAQSYSLWRRAVPVLRTMSYASALTDLAALSPLITHIGGSTTDLSGPLLNFLDAS